MRVVSGYLSAFRKSSSEGCELSGWGGEVARGLWCIGKRTLSHHWRGTGCCRGALLRNSRAGIPVLVILVQIRFYILLLILPGFWRHNFFLFNSLYCVKKTLIPVLLSNIPRVS